jgi:phosphoglucosamine mutase
MGRLFGTDGIRGTANADLSAELALDVGRAIALASRDGVLGHARRPKIVVGRDTRPSGDLLEAALVAGLCSGGADVLQGGMLPTPAVAYLTAEVDACAGVVLSASHNPVGDNGIKVFASGGWKLSEDTEDALEALVGSAAAQPTGTQVGRVHDLPGATDRYIDHLVRAVGPSLAGLRVVVDCAHGAACGISPDVLQRLGAEVTTLHGEPDGAQINEGCGATHPEVVAAEAARQGAIGLTHDGDADRVLAADEQGRIVDGDAIIAMLARRLRADGRLAGDAVVVTVMSNQALRVWCSSEGIAVHEVGVGDRNVLEHMRTEGVVLGGEQSGHVILLDRATTGDGILTGLVLLDAVARSGGRLAELVPFDPMPQILINVPTRDRDRLPGAEQIWRAVSQVEEALSGRGRVLLRPSGTEPLVRVMVEAPTADEAEKAAGELAAVVERELNGGS